jgi:pyrroline-5-carboxylate reductase
MENKPVITFIGAGNMASCLIGGLVADGYPPDKLWATDPSFDKLEQLQKAFNINVTHDNRKGSKEANIILFAVKPQQVHQITEELKDLFVSQDPLLLSIVTGIRSSSFVKWTNYTSLKVVRCMPNTPALLRCGTTGLWANDFVTPEERAAAESILRSVGVTLWLEAEAELDVVTAISGSGPAYFFFFMESILETARKMGLDEEQAQLLTVNTALGSARMALESGKHVKALRQQVTSPGGTTEQAIRVFEQEGLRNIVDAALTAAKDKAIAIANMLDD